MLGGVDEWIWRVAVLQFLDHICFRAIDSNKDGSVTLQEFEKFFENGKEKFNEADLDKDGKLSHDEYHSMLGHGSS